MRRSLPAWPPPPHCPSSGDRIRFLTLDELEAVLGAIPDQHAKGKLTWEQVCAIRASSESNCTIGRELGVSDSLISRIRRGLIWTDQASTENVYAEIDRVLILDRRHDRRCARGSCSRCAGATSTGSAEGARPSQLRPRRVRHAEVEALQPRRAARDACRRRAGRAAPAERVPGRRRPGVRPPADRQAARPVPGAQALQALLPGRPASASSPLPRPAPHVRDADGRGRRAAADAAGVDGARATSRRRRSTPTTRRRPTRPRSSRPRSRRRSRRCIHGAK